MAIVIRDSLYRVFDERTCMTTFAVIHHVAEDDIGIAVAAVRDEETFTRQSSGVVYTYVASGNSGEFDEWIGKILRPVDRRKRRVNRRS